MSKRDDLIAGVKRAADLLHESMLASTILHYARSGHASPLMIEQAIELIAKHISWADETGDQGLLESSKNLKAALEQALTDGVHTLRVIRGPGPEFVQVEEPLVRARLAAGRNIRRQVKCAFGLIDIYDLTTDELIECKFRGTSSALGEAAGQLQRYRKAFPGASLAIAVLDIEHEASWLADVLIAQGIKIIEISRGPVL